MPRHVARASNSSRTRPKSGPVEVRSVLDGLPQHVLDFLAALHPSIQARAYLMADGDLSRIKIVSRSRFQILPAHE